ncbi:hypothetical protein UA08_05383 [Talaromyces atroroseus]|uniref:DUF2470 domain-containing protein n=1 Tax=Talaromyces atroroseus TaxID=1441469 RepID=A0A225AWY3_TALAT|nr:hypothetical protein UA08_05383 [Talaromyces atroroseus]OKL59486.1 hypothetical protein UA08_05383 [Talaromyces atroroseus]
MSNTENGSNNSLHERQTEGKASSKEQLQQQRICAHMNSDHRDTLSLYLQVYCKVPSKEAQWPKMEKIRLDGMTISTANSPDSKSRTNFVVPFEPALNGFGDARHRTVEMHKYCLKALGRSDLTIQEYRAPTGFAAVMFTTCLLTFIAFSRRAHFEPGSELYSRVFQYVPGFATFCYSIQPLLIRIMAVIHLGEALHLWFYRLRPHNIRFGSRLWLCWFVNDFIEGYTALQRFDALVAEKRAGKAQH